MHFERDIIHDKVMPILNEKARLYGESVNFCDLRWGVNTCNLDSDEGSRKVLRVCLEEIDRCKPYMVVILGERYGWIPSNNLIFDAAEQKKFVIDENKDYSVTALEIEYGALSNTEQMKQTLFYFRKIEGNAPDKYKSEDNTHSEKLLKLKNKIKELGGRIQNYTLTWDSNRNSFDGLENFSEMLINDVSYLMEKEFKEYATLSEYERDQRIQWDFARKKSKQFAGRHGLVDHYIKVLNSGVNFLAIRGESGVGKSTVMGQMAVALKERGCWVLPLFATLTQKTNDDVNICRYITEYLEKEIPQSVSDYDEISYSANQAQRYVDKVTEFSKNHTTIFRIIHFIGHNIYKVCKNIIGVPNYIIKKINKFLDNSQLSEKEVNEFKERHRFSWYILALIGCAIYIYH